MIQTESAILMAAGYYMSDECPNCLCSLENVGLKYVESKGGSAYFVDVNGNKNMFELEYDDPEFALTEIKCGNCAFTITTYEGE